MNPQTDGLIQSFRADQHRVSIYYSSRRMAAAAAAAIAAEMRRLIAGQGRAVGLFTAAPSQCELLDSLVESGGIEWTRVIGFHLDEFVGLDEEAPQSSRRFLLDRLVRRVPMAEFHAIRGEAANPAAVRENLAALLRLRPPDFAVLEIGDNGCLGLASPSLDDSSLVRVVEMDDARRRQLVEDGVFANFEAAPRRAISVTQSAILACPRLFAVASGAKKAQAVFDCLHCLRAEGASRLRHHAGADLFLDRDAAAELSLGKERLG